MRLEIAAIHAEAGRVKRICAILVAVTLADLAVAQSVPLPRARPYSNSEPAAPPRQAAPTAPVASAPSACRIRLTSARAIAPSVDAIHGPGECGNDDLVRLEAVVLPDDSQVEINPPAVLRCDMAEAIVDWVRDDLAQLAAFGLGSRLRSVRNYAAYHCRSRNNIIGAMMSEHGKGNALDVRAITLFNGKSVEPTDPKVSPEFREGWKRSVCARFSTVLGPGSDGYHENHIHMDLLERRPGYRGMCQWDVRLPEVAPSDVVGAIPLPQPRPKIEPSAVRQ
jgi:hypothetical protein